MSLDTVEGGVQTPGRGGKGCGRSLLDSKEGAGEVGPSTGAVWSRLGFPSPRGRGLDRHRRHRQTLLSTCNNNALRLRDLHSEGTSFAQLPSCCFGVSVPHWAQPTPFLGGEKNENSH
ncbi:hypothetical protein EYF80_043651 [Liparis tanakae]|uniref:Uncharacterized protein n=1 Tax=Liparis tanakae TaxID=230148 RepID=A0A4Z2FXX9_9TELE|nr:hypothetical protein EYF80_043651 [Liparis tanakae]